MSGPPRILILGAAGQVGTELQRSFEGLGPIVPIDREAADLASPEQIRDVVRRIRPHIILNAAAYTAVDRAESEHELAHAINAQAPRVLAEEALRLDALVVHYSTDYVFDGTKATPWTEADAPNPLNTYGATKLSGEQAICKLGGRYLIFRTSWVYGPHGNNFLLTMLRHGRGRDRLSIVDDQHGAPTTSIELARATQTIVGGILAGCFGAPARWSGLYHMTCAGSTTWCGFARAIFKRTAHLLNERTPEVLPIASSDYPTPAKRPRNSVLSNAHLNNIFGVQLAGWEFALDEVVAALSPL